MNSENARQAGDQSSMKLAHVIEVLLPQVEKIEAGFTAIRVTLDALSEHLGAAPAAEQRGEPTNRAPTVACRPADEPRAEPPLAAVSLPPTANALPAQPASAMLPPMAQPLAASAAPIATAAPVAVPAAVPPPARAGSIPASGGSGGNWSQIIFGDQWKSNSGLSALSGTLLSEVYANQADAIGMLGYLLAFRAADQERKPKLLKELGEAFYQWQPDGNPRLLDPLIQWSHALLDQAGISNRIEVVQAGDRYDMQRHNAKERGAEVYGVAGWVVLRDNGKVYTKANVSVR
jgi:hypothetical protein